MSSAGKGWVIFAVVVAVIAGALATIYISRKPEPKNEVKRYPMTGIVLRVKDSHHVSIANDDIAGFMSPMVMDYEVEDSARLNEVKRGDQIRATLLSDGTQRWVLEDLTITMGQR